MKTNNSYNKKGKTKLGMDKKYLNEDIYIYENSEVKALGVVKLETIENYEGNVWINDRGVASDIATLKRKIEIMKDNNNSINPRYFPHNTKYSLQFICDVIKFDRNYVEKYLENVFDTNEERKQYIKTQLENN